MLDILKTTLILLLALPLGFVSAQAEANEVNIYSYRQPHLIKPLLDRFTAETGIKTNQLFTSSGIAEKLEFEGKSSPADLILTVDIYRLVELKRKGLSSQVKSRKLRGRIPSAYRDRDGDWYALTKRARIILASTDPKRAPYGEVESYLDLAKPELTKRLCIRPLNHIYNLGLTSSLISQYGEARTSEWLSGLKPNLARRPQGNDRAQIKGITQGICDYAVANHYYLGLLDQEDPKWTRNVRIIAPTKEAGGTHMNVSGMALARHAPNRENAIKLMEFLASDWAQKTYAADNTEIPIVDGIQVPALVELGDPDMQKVSIEAIASFLTKAQELVSRSKVDL